MSVFAVPGLIPVWVKPVVIGVALAGVAVALLWYRSSLIESGREEVRAEWRTAAQAAKDQQAANNAAAATALAAKVAEQKKVYKTRIEEILVYVPSPNTTCPTDADFERLYNSASSAGAASTK